MCFLSFIFCRSLFLIFDAEIIQDYAGRFHFLPLILKSSQSLGLIFSVSLLGQCSWRQMGPGSTKVTKFHLCYRRYGKWNLDCKHIVRKSPSYFVFLILWDQFLVLPSEVILKSILYFNVDFLSKIPVYIQDTESTIWRTPYSPNHVDCRRSLLNKGSVVSLSVPSNRWTKPLEIIYLFFWNSIWNKIQQCVAGAGEKSTFFLRKAYVIPTLFISKIFEKHHC